MNKCNQIETNHNVHANEQTHHNVHKVSHNTCIFMAIVRVKCVVMHEIKLVH
jgi:hypothetical protein